MGKRGPKPKDPSIEKDIVNECYQTILSMVEQGWDISKALSKIGVSRSVFYKNISKDQKNLLQMAKVSNTKFGVGYRIRQHFNN